MRDLVDELLHAKVKAQLFGGDHAPRLGRLIILERIGAGAMGDVFSAHDPRLDRKVAVKIVRPTAAIPADRVLAEARALAKLAHPNVVAIYDAEYVDAFGSSGAASSSHDGSSLATDDAGTASSSRDASSPASRRAPSDGSREAADRAIAIVMELAPGISLRTWLATPRDWRDIARVLREAASGLAAAHAVGLVHRDIKPDNILVGDDRTRVVDFGLAHASVSHAEDEALSGAGTPSYMAPEVLGGAPATPAADQFSFGVTLFEALYGVRPHGGASRDELRIAALAASTASAGTSMRAAPTWLHAIASRALAGDPRDRFASMDDLATALGHDRRRQRWLAIAIAGALAATGVGAFVATRVRATDPCAGAADRIATVWPAERAHQIRAQLGDVRWTATAIAALEARSTAWTASYRTVCQATRVRGEQSDTLLDLRMRCLDRVLERFDALAAALTSPLDSGARIEAASAVAELPDAAACESLVDAGELALPADPAGRQRAIAARHDIARAWAAFSLSRYRDARELGERIERDVAGLDAPSVIAELAAVRAAVEARIGTKETAKPALDRALVAASRANAPELETRVWAMRMRHELFAGDPARVAELLPLARAAAARARHEGAELDGIAGEALRDAGDLGEARRVLERAWASKDPLRADQRAVIAMNLGAVHLLAGDLGKAEGAFTRAQDLAASVLGDGHPSLALYLDKQAAVDRARGRVRSALARSNASLEMRIAAYGENDRSVATSLLGRARTYLEMGDVAAAKVDAFRAHDIRAAVFGETSPRLGEIEAVLGDIALATGDVESATGRFNRARELDERVPLGLRRWSATPSERFDDDAGRFESLSVASVVRTCVVVNQGLDHGTPTDLVRAPMADLVDRWRRIGRPVDPTMTYIIGVTMRKMGDNGTATELFTAGLADVGDEPTRTRLRFALQLLALDGRDELREAVRALRAAMPQLTGNPDRPGPD